ncbi:MAG: HAMP domain-containing histidine kinase [Planctomycetales bacterium]|nr:HAMP domain-containing histidine kinase [Planctomycetales bacterium]
MFRFQPTSIEQLLDLVLSPYPALLTSDLPLVPSGLRADPGFCQWASECMYQLGSSESAVTSSDGITLGHEGITLANALVRFSNWRSHVGCMLENCLWQAANLRLRLQGFEDQFTDQVRENSLHSLYHIAYGLSHELNNPLAIIVNQAISLKRIEDNPVRQQSLQSIIDNAQRGHEMLADFMLAARPPEFHFLPVQLADLVSDACQKARVWALPRRIELRTKIETTAQVLADRTALTEAIWCLIRNSIEAIHSDGTIIITLAKMPTYSQISIHDTGLGLSPDALQNCFEPYYSAREAGRGLGIGLFKAQRIVHAHQGEISLQNHPDGGCLATIQLPYKDS